MSVRANAHEPGLPGSMVRAERKFTESQSQSDCQSANRRAHLHARLHLLLLNRVCSVFGVRAGGSRVHVFSKARRRISCISTAPVYVSRLDATLQLSSNGFHTDELREQHVQTVFWTCVTEHSHESPVMRERVGWVVDSCPEFGLNTHLPCESASAGWSTAAPNSD